METILVTGGAGFIGSHLLERLLGRGDRIICIDNFDPYYPPEVKRRNIEHIINDKNLELIESDIRNKEELGRVFNVHTIDSIVHLAARAGVRASISDPHLYQDVNIGGTLNLLELAREHGIENFVFGSSSSVYGGSDRIPFHEDDSLTPPLSPYAATKQAGELFCHTYHHLYSIPVTCLRFFTVYGPRQRPDMAIHKFTSLIDRGEEIPLYGDGSSQRDYTYISDIIEGIVSAVDKKLDFGIINLGESQTTRLTRLISLCEENLGKKAKVKKLPDQPGDVPITFADISKAKTLLGYDPQVNIEDGIALFVQWHRKQVR